MPQYRLEALEKFVVPTIYLVDAVSSEQAAELCRKGDVAYERCTIEEGDEEWIETVSVEEVPD